jgi:hypothetical protein
MGFYLLICFWLRGYRGKDKAGFSLAEKANLFLKSRKANRT